jgi:hypothetical protein
MPYIRVRPAAAERVIDVRTAGKLGCEQLDESRAQVFVEE